MFGQGKIASYISQRASECPAALMRAISDLMMAFHVIVERTALFNIGVLIVPVPMMRVDVLVSVRSNEVLVEVEVTEVPRTLSKLSYQQTQPGT